MFDPEWLNAVDSLEYPFEYVLLPPGISLRGRDLMETNAWDTV